jgi:zinc protease
LLLGLKILYEWAFQIRISKSDVIEEKDVIMAEYTAKLGLSQRLLDEYWPRVFKDSLIPSRMPIGVPESFMNAEHENLRKFYRKWYRPENMAVIIVGDFNNDINLVEKAVIDQFEHYNSIVHDMDCSQTVVDKSIMKMPCHDSDVVIALSDKQITVPQISFELCFPLLPQNNLNYLKHELKMKVLTSVLNK